MFILTGCKNLCKKNFCFFAIKKTGHNNPCSVFPRTTQDKIKRCDYLPHYRYIVGLLQLYAVSKNKQSVEYIMIGLYASLKQQ